MTLRASRRRTILVSKRLPPLGRDQPPQLLRVHVTARSALHSSPRRTLVAPLKLRLEGRHVKGASTVARAQRPGSQQRARRLKPAPCSGIRRQSPTRKRALTVRAGHPEGRRQAQPSVRLAEECGAGDQDQMEPTHDAPSPQGLLSGVRSCNLLGAERNFEFV